MATKKAVEEINEVVDEVKEVKPKKVEKKPTEAEIKANILAYENELVTVKLFKDTGRYKDDVTVHVNGKNWQIQRGIEVKIPRYVARVLAYSDKQDIETAMMIEAKEQEYERNKNQLN